MEQKKKQKSEQKQEKPHFLSEIFKGLIESFFKGQMTKPEKEEQAKPQEKESFNGPLSVSNTYIIIHRERQRKGIFKWILSLFW
jgi:hypothetical protein